MKKAAIFILLILFVGFSFSLSSAEILYQNNFDNGNLEDWTHIASVNGTVLGLWSVVDGALQIDISSGGDAQNFKFDALVLPDSYIIEFDTRTILDGGGVNLIAFYTHWSDWSYWLGHHYRPGRFLLNGTGTPNHLVYLYDNADPSQWHHFKYIRDGNLVSLFFDSTPVYVDYVLPSPLTEGYFVFAGAASGIHQFDNLVIKTLDTCDIEELKQQVQELAELVDTLYDENADLQQRITEVEEQVSNHSHQYLTGKGKGHNKVEASTGPAIFPASTE